MPNGLTLYACSATIITLLLLLARHNRKTGWRRNRNNVEYLAAWQLFADFAPVLPPPDAPPAHQPPPEPEQLRTQLLALGAALAAVDERVAPTAAANPQGNPHNVAARLPAR